MDDLTKIKLGGNKVKKQRRQISLELSADAESMAQDLIDAWGGSDLVSRADVLRTCLRIVHKEWESQERQRQHGADTIDLTDTGPEPADDAPAPRPTILGEAEDAHDPDEEEGFDQNDAYEAGELNCILPTGGETLVVPRTGGPGSKLPDAGRGRRRGTESLARPQEPQAMRHLLRVRRR